MFTENIHNLLVYIFQEADSKMGLDVHVLIAGSIWEWWMSEVAKESCQTTMQAWCLWREEGRKEAWVGETMTAAPFR